MLAGTIVYALINSAILAMIAMGFNLTFGISGVANFAYGAFYVLAAYAVWILVHLAGLPYAAAVPLAIGLTTLVGALMYRLVLVRVKGHALQPAVQLAKGL